MAETVLALIAAADSEADIDSPGAWLRTVARRRIQDHFRAAARVEHLIKKAQADANDSRSEDPAIKLEQEQSRETVRDAMEGLPDKYRRVLEWKYIDKTSVRVIASRLATSEKSVESTLFRARKALRSRLRSECPEEDQKSEKKVAAKASDDVSVEGAGATGRPSLSEVEGGSGAPECNSETRSQIVEDALLAKFRLAQDS